MIKLQNCSKWATNKFKWCFSFYQRIKLLRNSLFKREKINLHPNGFGAQSIAALKPFTLKKWIGKLCKYDFETPFWHLIFTSIIASQLSQCQGASELHGHRIRYADHWYANCRWRTLLLRWENMNVNAYTFWRKIIFNLHNFLELYEMHKVMRF